MVHYKFEPNSVSLSRVAQFVFKKLITSSSEQDLSEGAQYLYGVCLGEVRMDLRILSDVHGLYLYLNKKKC